MNFKSFITCFILFFGFGAPLLAEENKTGSKTPVADGYYLSADYYKGTTDGLAALILHQYTPGYGRSDWTNIAEKLHKEGVTVLNVDQRGFGESKSAEFDTSDGDDQRMKSQSYLTKDAPKILNHFINMSEKPFSRLALIGSSCGGAMNIINSTIYEGDKIVAYLSAVIIDQWITSEVWAKIPELDLKASLYITSTEDRFSTEQSTKMFHLDKAPISELLIIKGNYHTIELFGISPTLEQHIATWLITNLKN